MTVYPPSVSSPRWDSRTKRIVVLICLFLIGWAIWQITDVLPIIVVSVLLSYLLNPVVTIIDQRVLTFGPFRGKSSRGLAILLTFILVFVLLGLVMTLVVPLLVDQLRSFAERLPDIVAGLESGLRDILSRPIVIGNQRIVPLESLQTALGTQSTDEVIPLSTLNIGDAATAFARSLTGPAFSFLGGAFTAILNFVFLITLMFYLIKDGAKFVTKTVEVTPSAYQNDVRRLFYELAEVWNAYLRGQLLLSAVMGVVVFVAAALLGVPNAPILGMLAGLLEFIPNIGPLIALIPAALLALSSQSSTLPFLEGGTFALVVIAVWTVLQNVESVVLVPRIMGDSLNLHPFVVMVGVIAGASLAGVLGVILAAPVIASLRVIGQYFYGKLMDRDPFPPPDPKAMRDARRNSFIYRLLLAGRFGRRRLSER